MKEVVLRKVSELREAEYNPRKISKKKFKELKDSINEEGVLENLVVNVHKDRKDIIISGHQRIRACRELGVEEVPVREVNFDLSKEKKLNVKLNKVRGDFATDKLLEMLTEEELLTCGFAEEELKAYQEAGESEKQFTETQEGGEEFDKEIKIKVSEETFNLWNKWLTRMSEELGYDNESKAFEFAIIEAMNTPIEKFGA